MKNIDVVLGVPLLTQEVDIQQLPKSLTTNVLYKQYIEPPNNSEITQSILSQDNCNEIGTDEPKKVIPIYLSLIDLGIK